MAQRSSLRQDLLEAIRLAMFHISPAQQLQSWFFVPLGLTLTLLICFGVNCVISVAHFSFPASVACMILLVAGLSCFEFGLGERRTKSIVRVLDGPGGFALKWIGITFTPSFVTLPLSEAISGTEIGKIIGIFVIVFLIIFVVSTYAVRGMHLLMGISKQAVLRDEDADATLPGTPAEVELQGLSTPGIEREGLTEYTAGLDLEDTPRASISREDKTTILQLPAPVKDSRGIRPAHEEASTEALTDAAHMENSRLPYAAAPLSRSQRWGAHLAAKFDVVIYTTFFLFIGLPVYYATGYAMPAQLCLNVLAYFAALALPPKAKRVLHPVLVSSGITILAIWILSLTRGETLREGLTVYRTKTKYLQLWEGEKGLPRPGAGDVFSSILDVSIVALALPMFQYRNELKRHILIILFPIIPFLALSLLAWPALCSVNPISLSASHSLSFVTRHMTLALATPIFTNLSSNASLAAVLCVISGIVTTIAGPPMLKIMKVPEGDYVTRGIVLGMNGGALPTAMLLVTDPRAAALSSLSMSLFGTVMVAFTSVGVIGDYVKKLAGMDA